MSDKAKELRRLLASGETLVMPDAYNALTARIIESLGYKAVQCSGYSFSLAAGISSEAAFGFERNLALTTEIVNAVAVPVMADGEDGFGDPSQVGETVKAFAKAGVAGINIEDQALGVPGPRSVVDRDLMVAKLKAAREAARAAGAPDLIVNARTDALAASTDRVAGLKEAIERANLYLEAGGDLAFVPDVATLDEVKALVAGIRGPVSIAAGMPVNINAFSVADLRACGVARVSLPAVAVYSTVNAVKRALEDVRDTDGFAGVLAGGLLCSGQEARNLSLPMEARKS